jgi:hypothetical protein
LYSPEVISDFEGPSYLHWGPLLPINQVSPKKAEVWPGTMAHSCNPSYLGGREQEVQFQHSKNVRETPSQPVSREQVYIYNYSYMVNGR